MSSSPANGVALAPVEGQQGFRWLSWLTVGVPLAVWVIFLLFPVGDTVGLFFLPMLAAVIALFFWLAPRRLAYTTGPEALTIQTLTGQTRLPYAGMNAWRTAGSLGLKMGGTGLPGYYTGNYLFHRDGLKNVLAAASNPQGGVIVQAGGRTYFLTPADPDAFLAELARRGARVREAQRSGV